MKKIIVILMLSVIAFTMCSCKTDQLNEEDNALEKTVENTIASEIPQEAEKKEPTGVPDTIVLRDWSIPEHFSYEILHNYEAVSHIDDVEIVAYYDAPFGTHTKKYVYSYQYDKSSDLWSLLKGKETADNIEYDADAFLTTGRFTGYFNRYETGYYDISILAIDFVNRIATVNYLLVFDRDSMVLQNTETIEISDTTIGKPAIFIEYNRSFVVRFDQAFLFDIEKGLYAAD